jgi:membrane-bound lytic murein transglycosylase A
VPAAPATALTAGLFRGEPIGTGDIAPEAARRALVAFRLSCPLLVKRRDQSGLTRPADWETACAAAPQWPDGEAGRFFAEWFEPVRIADGRAFATGYYEPEIAGSRNRQPGYEVPVYRRPGDLIEVDLGLFSADLKGKRVHGRVQDGRLIPYFDRAEIEDGALSRQGLEIAWAADPVELFFLQIQGSGRLRLPDGTVMRIGYDGQNGRDYTPIGRLLRERGLLAPGQASMQGIMEWLRANPADGKGIMRENRSWIFFRELVGPGPLGALGLPVTGRASVAVDPAFIPLGAPVLLAMDRPEASGLWVAQDTGGAIKGANRFDTFWGAGDEARTIAGGMSARGQALLLLPKGTMARLEAERRDAPPLP